MINYRIGITIKYWLSELLCHYIIVISNGGSESISDISISVVPFRIPVEEISSTNLVGSK